MFEDESILSSRDAVLGLLSGHRNDRVTCFSGLISVTSPGLQNLGLRLSEVHTDSGKMAAAAASSYHLFDFESAVVPLDLCVEAEVLGAEVDFRADAPRSELPRVVKPLADSSEDLDIIVPTDLENQGRIPVVTEAIRILKKELGQEIVIGAWVPGPVTLAMQLVDVGNLMREVATGSDGLVRLLEPLTDLLIGAARIYRSAGADLVTVHEMGGSPGFVGPPAFERVVLPHLQRLISALSPPRVLSICGNTNPSMSLLSQAGADALSLDQTNDLENSRRTLGPETILLGNIDPVGTLANGDEDDVRYAVIAALESGADAIWPACDLWPDVPSANMRAMIEETRNYHKEDGGV